MPTKRNLKQITITMPGWMHEALKEKANEKGQTIVSVIRLAITEYYGLKNNEKKQN